MKLVVTGVSGFVGRALAVRLLQDGHEVVGISRTDPKLPGLTFRSVDLAKEDTAALQNALSGSDAVFHTAAKVDMWGDPKEFLAVNLEGTRRLLAIAKGCNVRYFIFTSSPSVIAGSADLCGVDESTPYPTNFTAPYPMSKALAEQLVIQAASESFKTIALRPHLVFGPGDRNFMPLVAERLRQGTLKQIGSGKNLVDFCYIDDCVQAHLLALTALHETPDRVNGKTFFISQGDPYPLWKWIEAVARHHGVALPLRKVPPLLAQFVAGCMEGVSRLTRYKYKPLLTRFLVHEMSSHHYFSIVAARRELGFIPERSVDEALKKTFSVL